MSQDPLGAATAGWGGNMHAMLHRAIKHFNPFLEIECSTARGATGAALKLKHFDPNPPDQLMYEACRDDTRSTLSY
jgi:hypothetical protein